MQIVKKIEKLNEALAEARKNRLSIGFVPTMGALHSGHMSLISKSILENDLTICSVFVNPTQFNDPKDFLRYPRTIEADSRLLSSLGCDLLFAPLTQEIYPVPETTIYDLGSITTVLEGQYRPGHFNGVASVVKRLFEAVRPNRAYFGLKDYQQYLVIKALTKLYPLGVEIVGCDIIREVDGLAMSSRNVLLNPSEKLLATQLYKSLQVVKSAFGKTDVTELAQEGLHYLSQFPDIKVEYYQVVNSENLMPVEHSAFEGHLRALVAAYIGDVRLIDNEQLI